MVSVARPRMCVCVCDVCATRISEKMREENGVKKAVQLIEDKFQSC